MENSIKISDLNVLGEELLKTPKEIKEQLPISDAAAETVLLARQTMRDILDRKDRRLLVVVGPCSIHDLEGAREYAQKLTALSEELSESLYLVMRVYFCKPRTTVGWKGLINDPNLDGTFKIGDGLVKARGFLLELAQLGIPVGTEALDSITPQYLDDVVAWNAVGARTTESQTHREMSSGLSTPVGFKNGTDGNVTVAINALETMQKPHHFLGINQSGQCVVLKTRGNHYGHVILRGGNEPNYDAESVNSCAEALRDARLPENIVIDCSHGNSLKDHTRQGLVLAECLSQIEQGNTSIVGVMLESNLKGGRQNLGGDQSELEYGKSITDACVSWEETEKLLRDAAQRYAKARIESNGLG